MTPATEPRIEVPEAETTPLITNGFQDHQSNILPRNKLILVFSALALVHFISFLDQTAISTSLPSIALALNTGSSISWVGTSFLATSTSIQLINGRLSDIFGRKTCLIVALALMGLGNLLSGFSQKAWQLYVTRGLSGFGAGALNALVQITISDTTRLDQRGYYFEILGIAVALGNGLGPVLGGLLTERASWRWAFWFICPLTVVAAGLLALVLPGRSTAGGIVKKLKMIDWYGVLTSMVGVVLVLVSSLAKEMYIVGGTDIKTILDSHLSRRSDFIMGLANHNRHASVWHSFFCYICIHRLASGSIAHSAEYVKHGVSKFEC
jgi:MFS family permease